MGFLARAIAQPLASAAWPSSLSPELRLGTWCCSIHLTPFVHLARRAPSGSSSGGSTCTFRNAALMHSAKRTRGPTTALPGAQHNRTSRQLYHQDNPVLRSAARCCILPHRSTATIRQTPPALQAPIIAPCALQYHTASHSQDSWPKQAACKSRLHGCW
jgi:hypothetical protein